MFDQESVARLECKEREVYWDLQGLQVPPVHQDLHQVPLGEEGLQDERCSRYVCCTGNDVMFY